MKIKIRRKKYKKTDMMLCPKCMKPSLKNAFNVSGWLTNPMYKCTNCNYTGSLYFVPEDETDLKELEEKDEES